MSYRFDAEPPSPSEYVALRAAAGMGERTEAAARRGLPNSLHAVSVREEDTDDLAGTGRLVGNDGCFYQVVDIAVHPDHQGRGLGTRIVEDLLAYVRENAPSSAYVSLVADVDGFYERFGFEDVAPDSKGMALHVE